MEFACLNSKAEGPVKAGNVCGEKQMSRPEIVLLSLLLYVSMQVDLNRHILKAS